VGERRVTLDFDREGWSPKFFRECYEQGFDVLTFRRGPYPAWRRAAFQPITATVEGREVRYTWPSAPSTCCPAFACVRCAA
jgi:hypothetical protein